MSCGLLPRWVAAIGEPQPVLPWNLSDTHSAFWKTLVRLSLAFVAFAVSLSHLVLFLMSSTHFSLYIFLVASLSSPCVSCFPVSFGLFAYLFCDVIDILQGRTGDLVCFQLS